MVFFNVILVATALSLDAFATMSANYSAYEKAGLKSKIFVVVLISILHAFFAFLGYTVCGLIGVANSKYFKWVVVVLFLVLTLKSLFEKERRIKNSIAIGKCVLQAVVTSVDAFVGGITLSVEPTEFYLIIISIFAVTLIMTTLGLVLGKVLSNGLKSSSKYVSALFFTVLFIKSIIGLR